MILRTMTDLPGAAFCYREGSLLDRDGQVLEADVHFDTVYRDVCLRALEDGIDDEQRIIPFVISTGEVDSHNSTINQDGWELDRFRANPVVLWGHQASTRGLCGPVAMKHGLPVAQARATEVREGLLVSEAQFIRSEEEGGEAFRRSDTLWRLYRHGFLRAASVGMYPLEWTINEERGKRGRQDPVDYQRQMLAEWSCVTIPSNAGALAAKAHGIDLDPIRDIATELLDERETDERLRAQAEAFWAVAREDRSFFLAVAREIRELEEGDAPETSGEEVGEQASESEGVARDAEQETADDQAEEPPETTDPEPAPEREQDEEGSSLQIPAFSLPEPGWGRDQADEPIVFYLLEEDDDENDFIPFPTGT